MAIDDLKKNREETKWFPLFSFFQDKPYGYLATYDEIHRATGIDLLLDRSPLNQARTKLLLECKRALDCVRSIGYRIAEPAAHLDLAKEHRKRSWRQLVTGKRLLSNPNRSYLSDEQAQAMDKEAILYSRLYDGVRRPKVSGIAFQPKFSMDDARRADAEVRRTRNAQFTRRDGGDGAVAQ